MNTLIKTKHSFLFSLLVILVLILPPQFGLAQDKPVTVDFELSDIDGDRHRLSDFRGHWVIVNFWATWCGPCIREIPLLNEIATTPAKVKPIVIGIDFEQIDLADLRTYMDKLKISYLVLLIGDAPLIPFEPLKGLPTTYFVSPEGTIAHTHIGEMSREKLRETWQELTGSS